MKAVIDARNAFFARYVTIANYRVYGPIEYHVKGRGYVNDPIQSAIANHGATLINDRLARYSFAIWKERPEKEAVEMCRVIRERIKDSVVIFMVDEDCQYWFIEAYSGNGA